MNFVNTCAYCGFRIDETEADVEECPKCGHLTDLGETRTEGLVGTHYYDDQTDDWAVPSRPRRRWTYERMVNVATWMNIHDMSRTRREGPATIVPDMVEHLHPVFEPSQLFFN